MAKTYISALIGIAIKEGKIKSVQQPVGDFLLEFKEGNKSKITIEHLLTMSSGLEWDESYSNPFSVTTAAYYGNNLKELIDNAKVESEPGKAFFYRGVNTQVLAFIVEKATGKSVSDYATEKLWHPTGAEHSALWSLDKKDGVEKAYCCLSSNARDFARLGQLYLKNGNWQGKQIIPLDYLTASITPADITDDTGNKIDYYGYQWWLLPSYKGQNIFYARGILGQYIIVIPEKNIVVVRLGKKRDEKIGYHPAEVYKMIDETNKLY